MLHDNFVSLYVSSLSAYLRAQVQIDLVSVEQVPYDEYLKSLSASLLNVLNADALGGQALLEIDFGILFSMLDRLLGGKGAAGKVVRDLTDIEKVLAGNVLELALSDLKAAWEAVLPVTFTVASMETSAQFVQIVPGNDTVVLMLFEIRIGEFRGAMSLCIPYLLIKPILNKLNTQRWFVSDRKKASASARARSGAAAEHDGRAVRRPPGRGLADGRGSGRSGGGAGDPDAGLPARRMTPRGRRRVGWGRWTWWSAGRSSSGAGPACAGATWPCRSSRSSRRRWN